MTRDFWKILVLTCGLTGVVFFAVVVIYMAFASIEPRPIATLYIPPVKEEPPDEPNLSEQDKQLLKEHRATIQAATREIEFLRTQISRFGGEHAGIDSEIEDWESKKKIAEREIARIRAGQQE